MTDHPRSRRLVAAPSRLPEDSLAYALVTAAGLIADVVGGLTLTDALATLWARRPDTPPAVRGAILALVYALVNLVVDLLYGLIDPRLRTR